MITFPATPAWVATQHKAFLRWTNSHLESRGITPVQSLDRDFSDGVRLIQLLEIVGNESLGRYATRPKLRVQKAENVIVALEYIKRRGIQLHNIGAEDIVDGNVKLILGLLWTLILNFSISEINAEGYTAKEGLLLWCQRKTALYDDVEITDFSTSWNNGLAFCALLDRHRPDLIDYDALDKSDEKGNIELALKLASEDVGIPQLLDVEDVLVSKPDERSIMTYVAHWFHAFSALDKIETAGRRVEKFVEVMSSSYDLQHSYETRIEKFLENIVYQIKSWNTAVFSGTYLDARKQNQEFYRYKSELKRSWIAEKTDITSMLGNIKTKLATYGLKDYEPPNGLTLADLDIVWKQLIQAEAVRSKKINETIRDIKENLRKKFAETANTVAEKIDSASIQLVQLDGELEDQQSQTKNIEHQLVPVTDLLEELKKLTKDLEEAKVEENDYTVYSYDELQYELKLAQEAIAKKLSFIENQIVARSMTNLTPIQLEEFESVFRYFDKRQQNSLEEVEFAAALASLGLVYSEDEIHEVFDAVRGGELTVSFEPFIRYMVEVTEDQNTAAQVLQSFMEVAEGKPYVTEFDLRNSLIPDPMIEQLEEIMPKDETGQGLDYVKFMEKLCI
ncbi:calponin homology domain-containing protein [Lipomyces tetrasporus]|uniref:Calponin homology domain-containing protein n=1 Tax=Lipomyces tetrasporus TaxID=54092 RepID=A0AAD7VV33_9ASCO|nr:calponin homology domain-containing protein [Lipomyces tetrasporus]KAJ8103837.1 calponin homology domain-containing protein [Lipomyces tetrasporus]